MPSVRRGDRHSAVCQDGREARGGAEPGTGLATSHAPPPRVFHLFYSKLLWGRIPCLSERLPISVTRSHIPWDRTALWSRSLAKSGSPGSQTTRRVSLSRKRKKLEVWLPFRNQSFCLLPKPLLSESKGASAGTPLPCWDPGALLQCPVSTQGNLFPENPGSKCCLLLSNL